MTIDMFKNYPQPENYVPDNHPWAKLPTKLVIMAGETTEHSFEIPFNVETDVKDYEIIYRYDLDNIIVKHKDEIEVIAKNCMSILTCILSAEETEVFKYTSLDCLAQVKFTNLDDTISYSNIYKVKLMTSLDCEEKQ